MKNTLLIASLLFPVVSYAQQPPKYQANSECSQVQSLATSLATLKNNGATMSDLIEIKGMSKDGNGVVGNMAIVLFDMHSKGSNAEQFGKKMFVRCMKSNGY